MRDLTGAPSFEYEIGEESLPEKDYESMKEALQKDYLVYATVRDLSREDEYLEQLRFVGLEPLMTYEILSFINADDT